MEVGSLFLMFEGDRLGLLRGILLGLEVSIRRFGLKDGLEFGSLLDPMVFFLEKSYDEIVS